MPFNIPTLRDLVERARLSFRANLPGTDAWVWPNNIGPTAKVLGGLTHELFGFADYIAAQRFVLTADAENLERHGSQYGLGRRSAAQSRGFVDFVSTGPLTVDTGAVLSRPNAQQYRVAAGGSILGAGTLSVEVISVDAGRDTLVIGGSPMLIVSGVTGDATASVAADGLGGGSDIEDVESYRERLLFRIRNVPQGGSAADYVTWGSEVAGVTRVFVERLWNGPGTVRVFPVFDDDYDGGVAPPGRIEQVKEYIALLAPAGAAVTVVAPAPAVIDIDVTGLVPNTPTVQEAARAELRAMFRRLGRVAGNDAVIMAMPYLATPLSFSRSWIWQSVANAAGEQAHTIAAPSADIAIPAGSIPVLGTVTFS